MDRLISLNAVLSAIGEWIAHREYDYTNATEYLRNRIKAIPSAYKGMTNGEVVKMVFPDIPRTLEWHIQNVTDDDWWNSPYATGEKR